MPSNTLQRDQPTAEYKPGRTVKLDLPREHYYELLNLVLDYSVDVGAAASIDGNGILDLIENVKVEYNGDKTPKSQSFAMSHFVDNYEYGSKPLLDPVDPTTEGTQTGRAQSFVQFLMSPNSYGAMLPSFLFSGLTLEIKWATADAIGSDITVNEADTAVRVESRERKRGTVPNESTVVDNLVVFKETEVRRELASQGRNTVDLPQGNVYHSLPTQIINDGSPDDDLLDRYEIVENSVDTHKAVSWDLQRANDYQRYQIEEAEDGVGFINYAQGADTDDVVATSGMDSYQLQLYAGAEPVDAKAKVLTREIIHG